MSLSSRKAGLLISTSVVLIMIVLSEVALRALAPVPDPYSSEWSTPNSINPYIRIEYPRNYIATTEAEPGLPGITGRHRFTTNSFGFRGGPLAMPKPADEYRVFMVGGSTTECFYLDDEEAYPSVTARALEPFSKDGRRIHVYNLGLSGAASDDHIALISQRLVHLDPDLIVLFTGINDLRRGIVGFDYLHFDVYGPEHWVPSWKRMLMRFQLARRVFYLSTKLTPDASHAQEVRPLKSNYARAVKLQQGTPESDAVPQENPAAYEINLRTIVGMAKEHGFGLAFLTQPTTWSADADSIARSWHWMRHYQGVTYREEVLDAVMERLNDVTRGIADSDSIPVCDLARTMPRDRAYFYDDCHFNTEGAAWVGEHVAAFLAETLKLEPADSSRAASASPDSLRAH